MKIVTVLGARPQFVKAAALSAAIRDAGKPIVEVLLHTGQHFDNNMSDIFFKELGIPEPAYNLGIGTGSKEEQTSQMLQGIKKALLEEKPDAVLVYGDTHSTLVGSLMASKMQIPVIHVEAGLRSFNRRMPEETNRLVTDHLSSLLLCPTPTSVKNLEREGIQEGIHLVGDVMHDIFFRSLEKASAYSKILQHWGIEPVHYFLATLHRTENTDETEKLKNIVEVFSAAASPEIPIVWVAHPHTRNLLEAHRLQLSPHVILIPPVSYFDMLVLERNAKMILTDSGGVQKEACWLGIPCVTLREETEWVEMLEEGNNIVAGTSPERVIHAIRLLANRPVKIRIAIQKEVSPSAAERHVKKILEFGGLR